MTPVQPGGPDPDIGDLRREIDGADADIVRLIGRRLELVTAIGRVKTDNSRDIRDPDRERAVLEAVESTARDVGVSPALVRRIFEEIVSHSVTRQAAQLAGTGAGAPQLLIAYQGVENAYSYLAAQKYLEAAGLAGRLVGYRSFGEVVAQLRAGVVDRAVLPIENTTAGSINEVYDLLLAEDLAIVGEETWRVDHCLAGPADVPLSAIERVLSHPQALEQCSVFLQTLPQARPVTYFDTAEALRRVAEDSDPAQAAIGSPEAAASFGLVVIRHGVANQEENHTRFVVLSRTAEPVDVRVPCKTSLVLATRHEEGALLRCLEVLAASGLSLNKLESRPRRGRPWEYLFFVDIDGNIAQPNTAAALDELRTTALYLKVLGSYPATVTPGRPHAPALPPSGNSAQPGGPAVREPAPRPNTASPHRLVDRAARPGDTVVRIGDLLVGGDGFVVMAGPCAVESADQIDRTARHVHAAGARVLRGGVFKPRTSPYSFQGLGYDGLEMLSAAGRANGMPIVTEVMAVEQVRHLARHADVLQIGARNMQNFDLLRAVGKVDRPVLLKRGLSSTVDEWLAAAEYILQQGNQQVMLCERGIRTFERATRNTLDLSAVVVLRERTHLPVVVDPSHGTGYRRFVAPMAWAARTVGAHGLLIEVHPDPDSARSDGDQSLNFAEFSALMAGLPRRAAG